MISLKEYGSLVHAIEKKHNFTNYALSLHVERAMYLYGEYQYHPSGFDFGHPIGTRHLFPMINFSARFADLS